MENTKDTSKKNNIVIGIEGLVGSGKLLFAKSF